MRLAERNDLRESEGQQATRYLEGLKSQIRDKIGVQVMRNLHEAKNLALKAEFMMQDRGSYEPPRRNCGGEASRTPVERKVTSREPQMRYDKFREEKAAGKQKVNEVKEAPNLPIHMHGQPQSSALSAIKRVTIPAIARSERSYT